MLPNQLDNLQNLKDDKVQKLFGDIKKRRKFIYSFKDIIWELFWLKKWKLKSESWKNMQTRSKIFDEGIKMLHSELDYAYILKSIRELKALVNSILDQDQQLMLQFHQTKLLDPYNWISKEFGYSSSTQIQIPNERWNSNFINEFERKVSEDFILSFNIPL